LFASEFKFAKHGRCGAELSEALPYLAEVVDDIAIVKSMTTDAFNHAPGQVLMQTGATQFGRPSLGAWVVYGLGSAAQNLPGFVVLNSAGGLSGGTALYGSGFLPTVYQGVPFRKSGDPVLFLSNPAGVTEKMQRRTLDLIKDLNEQHLGALGDPEIATRINSFEMAYRMQSSAPELMDVSKETPETLKMYGAEPGKPSCNCSTKAGTITAKSSKASKTRPAKPTRPARRLSRTSNNAGCSTTPWCFGAASLAARRWSRPTPILAASWGAIITRKPSRCGWPAAASNRASRWARRTN
jgi:hypothetical protein